MQCVSPPATCFPAPPERYKQTNDMIVQFKLPCIKASTLKQPHYAAAAACQPTSLGPFFGALRGFALPACVKG
jgi:hypothetical protein